MVAKVEWYAGELFPRVGFIVTNLKWHSKKVVRFYNRRGRRNSRNGEQQTVTESPLFIIGTERSGSNLLRLILNTHSRIAIPHPPHVVRYFAPLEAAYGDLSRSKEAFTALVDDILAFVRMHIYPWDIPLDRARVLREA